MVYADYADINSMPFMIKVFKIIDKKYPEINGGRICTYNHCIYALNMIAKEKLDFKTVREWEEWWEKKKIEKRNSLDLDKIDDRLK